MSAGSRSFSQDLYVAFGVVSSGCVGLGRSSARAVCVYGVVPESEINEFYRKVKDGEIRAPVGAYPDTIRFLPVGDVAYFYEQMGGHGLEGREASLS